MPKFENSEIQRECKNYSIRIKAIQDMVSAMLVGKRVRIISDFNGQMYGTSKKSMKGREFVVESAHISHDACYVFSWKVSNVCIPIEEVEFLEDLKCGE